MALHSGTRHPLNPAVGDVITSLGWSNRFAVAAYDCTSYRHLPAACSGWDGCHHNWGCTGSAPSQFAPSPGWDIWHQCNLSCVPAFHRVGGWGVRPATRFVRYHFNCAVFPAVSRSLTVIFRSPWSARIPALPRESGEVSQPGCRCYVPKRFVATAASVVLALRLGSSFALNSIPNFWLAYIRFVFGQYLKVSFSGFFSFGFIWCKTGACWREGCRMSNLMECRAYHALIEDDESLCPQCGSTPLDGGR